jgi:hypothetical protein
MMLLLVVVEAYRTKGAILPREGLRNYKIQGKEWKHKKQSRAKRKKKNHTRSTPKVVIISLHKVHDS